MDERKHIARLKQGELAGLEALVKLYQVRAVHAAYMIVFDRPLAEDIAQTAFIKVMERIEQFDEQRPFAPWFFRIVVNDALKAAGKRKRNLSLDTLLDGRSDADWHRLTDPAVQPEQEVLQRESTAQLLNAIEALPPDQRAVIVMRYYLGLSAADMSTRLERPVSTIKWWLRDARKRLATLMNA